MNTDGRQSDDTVRDLGRSPFGRMLGRVELARMLLDVQPLRDPVGLEYYLRATTYKAVDWMKEGF